MRDAKKVSFNFEASEENIRFRGRELVVLLLVFAGPLVIALGLMFANGVMLSWKPARDPLTFFGSVFVVLAAISALAFGLASCLTEPIQQSSRVRIRKAGERLFLGSLSFLEAAVIRHVLDELGHAQWTADNPIAGGFLRWIFRVAAIVAALAATSLIGWGLWSLVWTLASRLFGVLFSSVNLNQSVPDGQASVQNKEHDAYQREDCNQTDRGKNLKDNLCGIVHGPSPLLSHQ